MVFLDIETVPLYPSLENMKDSNLTLYKLWDTKYHSNRADVSPEQFYLEEAGIHAAVSRVACIGIGRLYSPQGQESSWEEEILSDLDEKKLLETFSKKWREILGGTDKALLCGHNIRNFDLPFIGRRLLINKLPLLPFWIDLMQNPNSKTYSSDISIADTMQMWKFGSYGSRFVSLEELATLLGLTFKKQLDHHEIRKRFYDWFENKDRESFKEVEKYCLMDVRVVAWCYLAMMATDSTDVGINQKLQSKIPITP